MQKIKNKTSFFSVIMVVSTYLSFCFAYWFEARGLVAGTLNSPILANELVAGLVGGILPFIVFEVAVRMYLQPLHMLGLDIKKSIIRLRIYFIIANSVAFGLSFVFFALPFLSVWGRILLNFLVLGLALVLYLIAEFKKSNQKAKTVFYVHRVAVIFLMFFGIMSLIKVFMRLL